MSQALKKKLKLKQQHEAMKSWPDIFDEHDAPQAIECHHGDRVSSAHIRQFESATEDMVLKVWGTQASTTEIVKNWDNFILGQLLDATQLKPPACLTHEFHEQSPSSENVCEFCLRQTANMFVRNLTVTRVSSDSTGSTPATSRSATPVPGTESTSATMQTSSDSTRTHSRPLRIWALDTLDLRIYVNSSYIHLLRSSPASICRDSPSAYTGLYLSFRPSDASYFPPCSNPAQHLSVYTLLLATDSQNLLSTENAGGSSIESEVLSFEVLKRIMPYWELSTMEMSTKYATSGPITDYVARSYISREQEISVSVTRVFGWTSNMKISKSSLTPLLIRKLSGLRSATLRILPRRQRGMVLFIWVPDGAVEKNVRRVWSKLRDEDRNWSESSSSKASTRLAYGVQYQLGITRNVIVFVGVCKKESWMDLRGWKRVFGKVDSLENQYLYALTGDEKFIMLPSPPASPQIRASKTSFDSPPMTGSSTKLGPTRRKGSPIE